MEHCTELQTLARTVLLWDIETTSSSLIPETGQTGYLLGCHAFAARQDVAKSKETFYMRMTMDRVRILSIAAILALANRRPLRSQTSKRIAVLMALGRRQSTEWRA